MRYYSQLELEKIIEYLYDRQVASTLPKEVENNEAIIETRRLLMLLQEDNRRRLDRVLNRPKKRR